MIDLDADQRLTLTDIPGLIEGAHKGTGLGHKFLGHIERCPVLIHLLDVTEPDIVSDYQTLRHELIAYDDAFSHKPFLLAVNKVDAVGKTETERQVKRLRDHTGKTVFSLSAVSGTGTRALLHAAGRELHEFKTKPETESVEAWTP